MLDQQLEEFYEWQKKIQLHSTIWNVLANDQNNRMPSQAQKTRSDQLAYVSKLMKKIQLDYRYITLVT
jgi:Zn-dependent M32 family carboxypeptidase